MLVEFRVHEADDKLQRLRQGRLKAFPVRRPVQGHRKRDGSGRTSYWLNVSASGSENLFDV